MTKPLPPLKSIPQMQSVAPPPANPPPMPPAAAPLPPRISVREVLLGTEKSSVRPDGMGEFQSFLLTITFHISADEGGRDIDEEVKAALVSQRGQTTEIALHDAWLAAKKSATVGPEQAGFLTELLRCGLGYLYRALVRPLPVVLVPSAKESKAPSAEVMPIELRAAQAHLHDPFRSRIGGV